MGSPKGTVQGYPFGSWSLPMIWKLCHGLWLWCNMRKCWIGFSGYWDCTTMIWNGNEIVLICSLAIEIHSDATPSYAMMQSDRRGLWWICNEFKPLPAYTTMVVSLWFSFEDFSQVFPTRDYGVYIEWCAMMMIFVRVFSQWGFWVYISVCNPKWYPKIWYPVLAWGECLMTLSRGYH